MKWKKKVVNDALNFRSLRNFPRWCLKLRVYPRQHATTESLRMLNKLSSHFSMLLGIIVEKLNKSNELSRFSPNFLFRVEREHLESDLNVVINLKASKIDRKNLNRVKNSKYFNWIKSFYFWAEIYEKRGEELM